MALHPAFPDDPHAILDPAIRWFPADETLRASSFEKLLPPLVPTLRKEVKAWRDRGYDGASDASKALLRWWFIEQHLLPKADGSLQEFQYFFAQREALETIVFLYDVVGVKDKYDLMRFDSSGVVCTGMFDETWRRFVVKMATGAGKTKVLSLVLAWSFFQKTYEPDSTLARNFLVIAPNIIVLDRIRKDFDGLRIFFHDPVLPDDGFEGRPWRDDFQLTLHVQDDVRVVRKTGNIFLTNIHRVYAGNESIPSVDDEDTMDYFLGPRPTGGAADSKVDLGVIVREIEELAVLNDEAHHIHDPAMAWFKSIEDIHHRLLQKGSALALQVDTTATPRHNNGAIFVQTVSDYPLVEAISQNVVKHPVLPDQASRAKLHERPSAKYTEKYADYLHLGVIEWRKAFEEHEKLGKKAVLFVMTDDTRNCDDVAAYLEGTYPDLKDAVLVIHTKNNGEISEASSGKSKEELDDLRKLANEIDNMQKPLQGDCLGVDAQRGLGRSKRDDHCRLTSVQCQKQYLTRADAGPRAAKNVLRRRAGIRERRRHRRLYGVCRVDPGRRRGAGAQGDGRRHGCEGAAGGGSRPREPPKGFGEARHRNSDNDAAHLPRIQKSRPARPGENRAHQAAVSEIQRRRETRDRIQGRDYGRNHPHDGARSGRVGGLHERDRLFRSDDHEGFAAGERIRRAVPQGEGFRARLFVWRPGRAGGRQHPAKFIGAGRDEDHYRRIQESNQRDYSRG